ncbi:hypothetical protein DL95DRAFT_492655 [Leptodontidium sp. 2 PMI_412]|nr:hypothetical protein DL95DRAFT_492655 [Leptodontidium sp. 2 PMI_412]
MSDLPFHCVADVCSELFPLDPILESDWFENALQDLYTAPEYWQDVDHADMPSFLDSTLPYSLDNTVLHYSLDATSQPGPDLQVPTCDTIVSDSDHLQISLLGCFPRDHEASLPQEPSLSPLLPRNERAHASKSKNVPFEQHLHEFDAGTNTAATGRKRKRFSTQRREEVACGGPKLGRTLCTRQSLVNVRFTTGNVHREPRVYFHLKTPDLWNRNSDDLWLKQRITSFVGPMRSLLILLDSPVFCHDEQLRILEHPEETCPAQPKLRIQVQSCE